MNTPGKSAAAMEPTGPPVLVLGATGGQGGAVAAALRSRGVTVRAMVRTPGAAGARALIAAGAEVVPGSFTDAASLQAAMHQVSAVFALTTPFEAGPDAEVTQGMTLIAAAAAAQVPYFVYSSVAGALNETGVPHFDSKATIERALSRSGLRHAVLAPTYFYDNLTPQLVDLVDGYISLPLPAVHPLQQLDRDTFGQLAAAVLIAPQDWSGQRLEVAADAPTGEQMAHAVTQTTRRPVRYQAASLREVEAVSPDMGAMWRFLSGTGYQVDIASLQSTFPSIGFTSFAQWVDGLFDPSGRGEPR